MALHRDHEIMAQSIRLCRECAEICKPLLCNGASELVNFS
ncbi:MAG: four-helix bundle copper-binding protein [Nitrospira sp.]|nr:four-helix bundle copper-binding protein [Nitrospira sp.]